MAGTVSGDGDVPGVRIPNKLLLAKMTHFIPLPKGEKSHFIRKEHNILSDKLVGGGGIRAEFIRCSASNETTKFVGWPRSKNEMADGERGRGKGMAANLTNHPQPTKMTQKKRQKVFLWKGKKTEIGG
jgi:hypothetical protein